MDREKEAKHVQQAVATVMSFGGMGELHPTDRAALDQAFHTLDAYRGQVVAAAFVEWQQRGQLRRMPQRPPARVTDESSSSLQRVQRPFRTRSPE